MSVDLLIKDFLSAQPTLLDWGSVLSPALGGADQRLNRLGSRFSVAIETDPEDEESARILLQRLLRAQTEGARVCWPQLGLDVGVPGSPRVKSAVVGGKLLPLKGLTPYYAFREGQFLSIIHGGRRYLHSADEEVIADAQGDATLTVTPMLRVALSIDDIVEIAHPKIEGLLEGDARQWTIAAHGHEPFSFVVREME